MEAPWLVFEAGALARQLADSRVVPYLVDLEPSDLPQGPLSQFRAVKAEKQGTLELIRAMNSALSDQALDEPVLERIFEKWWPDLKEHLSKTAAGNRAADRPADDKLDEILLLLRDLAREERVESLRELAFAARDDDPIF